MRNYLNLVLKKRKKKALFLFLIKVFYSFPIVMLPHSVSPLSKYISQPAARLLTPRSYFFALLVFCTCLFHERLKGLVNSYDYGAEQESVFLRGPYRVNMNRIQTVVFSAAHWPFRYKSSLLIKKEKNHRFCVPYLLSLNDVLLYCSDLTSC